MACWSASVDAAEAKKAEDASIVALPKPIPPFFTGSVAWNHWVSSVSTFSITINQLSECRQIGQVMDDSGSRRFSKCIITWHAETILEQNQGIISVKEL